MVSRILQSTGLPFPLELAVDGTFFVCAVLLLVCFFQDVLDFGEA
jgi:hypothetical protein